MKRYPVAALALLLVVVSAGCSSIVNKLKARDQLNKGVNAFRNAQFQAAIDHFQQAVAFDPGLVNAHLYLAMSYFQQYVPGGTSPDNIKIGKQAIEKFQEVLKMQPNNPTALATIAQIYYNMKEFDKAKEYQRKRIEADPNNPEPYYWIGVIDWAICLPRQVALRRELRLDTPKDPAKPDILPPLPEKARAKLAEENGPLIDEGIKALQKDLQMKPNDSDAMAYMNLLLRQKADIEESASAREADLKAANDWVQKALEARKQNATKASSPAT